jgi:hypothetical protein
MAEPLRHRQTKEAETDMFDLQPPRHIPTLPWLCKNALAEASRRELRDLAERSHFAEFGGFFDMAALLMRI